MRRIAVIGCGGSGKSRLARELGRRLDLPVIHLDAHYWRPGWVEAPMAEWIELQTELFAGEAWIADGNFHSTLRYRTTRADTVVFLDFPRSSCVRGVLGRLLRQRGQVRSDMATGCPERFDPAFLRWVWNFRRDARPRTLEILRDFGRAGGRVIRLHSRAAVAEFLRSLPADSTVTHGAGPAQFGRSTAARGAPATTER
jgi:adenylate kinase family enzyme